MTEIDLGLETSTHLRDSALRSFEHFSEMDESVWRSLPFFAAVFGLAATLIGAVFPRLPPLGESLFGVFTYIFTALAVASFGWAFRWMLAITKVRSYEFPADSREVAGYAVNLSEFHKASGLTGPALDIRIKTDLLRSEAEQLSEITQSNAKNVRERLKARSQALEFVMIGFALALTNSITIYVHDRIYATQESGGFQHGITGTTKTEQCNKTDPATGKCRAAGSGDISLEQQGRRAKETVTMTEQMPAPAPPPQERPQAPPPQRVERSEPPPPDQR